MGFIIGGLVGWYVTGQFICMPTSKVDASGKGYTSYPCGTTSPLPGPLGALSVQTAIGATIGAVIGHAIMGK